MLQVSVQNGTNAGRRAPKKNSRKTSWKCASCDANNAYYWKNCPACGAQRAERS